MEFVNYGFRICNCKKYREILMLVLMVLKVITMEYPFGRHTTTTTADNINHTDKHNNNILIYIAPVCRGTSVAGGQ